MQSPSTPQAQPPHGTQARRTRWLVTGALLLALGTLAVTNVLTLHVLSAVRAYVGGESLWTKGQKDASYHLQRYSESFDPAELASFEAAVAVPLGDRAARLALDAPTPDKAAARRGFVQGGNHPDDVEAMIDLFLWFRNVGFMARAIDIWAEADREIDGLLAIAERLKASARQGLSAAERAELRADMLAVNQRLTRVEQRFTEALGEASRMTLALVTAVTTLSALLLAAGVGLVVHRAFSRISDVERALREGNERWTLAAQAAKAEVFDWDLATDAVTRQRDGRREVMPFEQFVGALPPRARRQGDVGLARARASGGVHAADLQIVLPDGSVRWISELAQFLYDNQRQPYRLIGVRVDITERKNHERELQAWRDRFEAFVNASGQILYDWNMQADEVTYAGNVEGILGDASAQLDGALSRWLDRVHPLDRDGVAHALRQADAAHDVVGLEYRVKRADGAWITVAQEGRAIAAHDDLPPRLVGFIADISERKQAQAALVESEQRFRTLWETAPEAVLILDESGCIDYANAGVTRTFGWEPQELIGQNIELMQPPRLRDGHRRGIKRYLDSGQRTMDWRAAPSRGLHRDGHEIALEISFSHMVVDGRHRFVGFLRDVEARQRAEAANTRLANLLEKSVNEVYVYRADTLKFTYVNAAARDNLRRTKEELLQLGPADLAPGSTEASLRSLLEPLLDGRQKTLSYETEHLRSDGSRYPAEVSVQLVDDGAESELMATALDISARRAAEAARGELLAQLRQAQKMEALGTLAGGIAHDFNNIVGSMLGNVALARQDLSSDHPAAKSVEQIHRAALRARDLVRQILAFSRRQPPDLVLQPLQPIVQDMAQLLRATLPATVALELDLMQDAVWIQADRSQIEQVLMNLCTNAWHALNDGSGLIRIGVGWRLVERDVHRSTDGLPPGHYAHLSVADNGIGMDAATCARIFEPFFTTKPVHGGTGLGLSVVHGIVVAHDGAIDVESRPGRGTTFHVFLPLKAAPEESGAPSQPEALSPPKAGRGERLLVLDDDEVMLLMVERLLQRAGYHVTACQDAAVAIAAVRSDPNQFDLLITDYNMPEMSGLDVARTVGELRADLPVVLVSGDVSQGLVEEARALAVAALVRKENTFEELAAVVQQHLGAGNASTPHTQRPHRMTITPAIPADEARRLLALRELQVLDTPPEPMFDAIARLASDICGAPIALLSLVDDQRQWFKANVGLQQVSETARDVAFCAHAILDDAVLVVPDTTLDERFADNPLVTGAPQIRFYAGAPLVMLGGERIGTLCAIDVQARPLDSQQIQRLKALAKIAAQALSLRRLTLGAGADSAADQGAVG